MEKKVAFFDMDGTLVAPFFRTSPGNFVIGFSKLEWIKFCNEKKSSAYNSCVPMVDIINYAKQLVVDGYTVKILTVICSEGEKIAKEHWVESNPEYRSIFSEVICVPDDHSKIEYIKEYVQFNDIDPHDCIVVEDTFNTVLEAIQLGISALHISHILVAK